MKVWVPLSAASVFIAAILAAQQNPAQQSDDPTRIIVDVTRVNLLFTVMDKKGRFVTDLAKDDFEVIESKRPQVIQELDRKSVV